VLPGWVVETIVKAILTEVIRFLLHLLLS